MLQSEEHYRDLVENSLDLMCTHDLNGVLLTVNLAAARALGYEPSELVKRNLRELLSPKVRAELEVYLALIREKGVATGFMRLQTKSGETRIWKYNNTLRTEGVEVPFVRGIAHDFTEILRTQKALRESEERLRTAAEIGRMYAWEWNPATDAVRRSTECAGILGSNDASLPRNAKEYFVLVHPDDRARLWSLMNSLTPADAVYRTVYRMYRPDGVLLWLEESARATFDRAGKMIRLVGMTADITEHRLAEDKLREYERAVEGSEEMIAVVDTEYRYVIANRRFLDRRRMTKEQVIGRLIPEVMNKGVFETIVKEKLDECFRGNVVRFEMKYTYPELGERDLLISYFPIEGANGIDRVACILQDITEHKRAQAQRLLSENRFRQFFETMPEYCYMVSLNGEIVDANPAACAAFGYTRDELIGKPLALLYAPECHVKMSELFRRWRADGALRNEEMVIITKEGLRRTVLLNVGSVRDPDGTILHSTWVQVDITERKKVEEALRESEARFELVANTAPVMIWMSGIDGRPLYFNRTWLGFTGRSLEDELRFGLIPITHPDDYERCHKIYIEAFDAKLPFRKECRLRRHDGEYRWMLDVGVPRVLTDGSFAGYIGCCVDVTDHKLAEEALGSIGGKLIAAQEAERTRIARELHDDVNQQLALVVTSLDELRLQPPRSLTQLRSRLEEVGNRTIEVSNAVQALSHQLHSSKLGYLGLVSGMEGLCREFSDQYKVEVRFSHEQVPNSLPGGISLCLFRILQGALKNAVRHSGVKSFEVGLHGTTEGIHLTIRDQGKGFDVEQALSGHGIGLISMRERARLVNGTISIESKPNCGTTIEVDVPLKTPTADAQSARSAG